MDNWNNQPEAAVQEPQKAIGREQLLEFNRILNKYRAGKAQTEARIVAAENWWKLRNTVEEQKATQIGADGGYASVSAWLHNVIASKHADAIENYPEPNILPREEGDKQEAHMLSAIIPCVLEQNNFQSVYDLAMWSKMKFGTAVYKVVWDRNLLNGLGDIRVDRVNLLNLYWEPGIEDIQKSRYVFHVELVDKDLLRQRYPDLADRIKGSTFQSARFRTDDNVDDSNKATVIEVYYRVYRGGQPLLHYCRYVDDYVIYATENETEPVRDDTGMAVTKPMSETGLYDHGLYPYVFDALFPIEGSPCGYGFVDLGRNPQTAIDLMNTAFVKNAMVGALPRYISSNDNQKVNEKEFLDTKNPIVHVNGDLSELSLRAVPHNSLDGNYLSLRDQMVQEMRETTGNTETSNGSTPSGVTAASAIAALQEASGKGSRDSTQASYRAYEKIVKMCIELIRQFYTLPRKFRIVGEMGAQQFISFDNSGMVQQQPGLTGDLGIRRAEFDIRVHAQRKNVYTKVANNEMALQFFQLGFFNPNMAEQALMTLDMMDFDQRDTIMQKISKNATVFQKMVMYAQQTMMLAQAVGNLQLAQQAAMDLKATGSPVPAMAAAPVQLGNGEDPKTSGIVANAREQSANSTMPREG